MFGNENKAKIIHCNLSKMKSKILPTCLQRNYSDRLGEISNTSCVFGAGRVIELIDIVGSSCAMRIRPWTLYF